EPDAFFAQTPAAKLPVIDIEFDFEPTAEVEPESEGSEFKTASELVVEPIDQLQSLVMSEIAESAPIFEVPPHFIDSPISAILSNAIQPPTSPQLELSIEYQELCQHLLARFHMEKHSTLITIDAGQAPTDASWLFPFAAGIVQTHAAVGD